jgi:hypothetical protein
MQWEQLPRDEFDLSYTPNCDFALVEAMVRQLLGFDAST